MNSVQNFKTVDAWRTALGLLPVPLRENGAASGGQYVLLNGTTGNFCLDFVGAVDRTAQRAAAWSCDVGHYVTCINDSIVVNRWDKSAPENYSARSVVEKLHEFHRHLEKTSPDRSRSIVAHVLRVFRQIRAAIEEQTTGIRSLRILLHLLASAAAHRDRLSEVEEKWGITSDLIDSSRTLPEATWHSLYTDLSGIGRSDDLRPDVGLVLRHASGAVFQDAHIQAHLSPALWLPGLEQSAFIDPNQSPGDTGIYFTPPALARTLAEEATRDIQSGDERPLTLFDPACGSGELLKECVRLLNLRGHRGRVRAVGWDKSPAAIDMTHFVLNWEKRTWPPGLLEVEVAHRDSLTAIGQWPHEIDILLMNPPFKSWQRMQPLEQDAVAGILGGSNKPNLAMAFAHVAQGALRGGGTLAMIGPASLFQASSGKTVREAMADTLTPQLIARLGNQSVFARALVDAGMYVGKRNPARPVAAAVLWADSRPHSLNRALRGLRRWREAGSGEPIGDEGFSVYHDGEIAKTGAPWVARAYDAWATHRAVRSTKRTVPARRVFDIKQGARLGNDAFVVSKEYVKNLTENEQRFFRPAVMNVSISDARLDDHYYVFYPYTNGLPRIQDEADLREHVPTYLEAHLLPAKPKLLTRRSLASEGLNWWDLERPREWQMTHGSKIVSKYFGGVHPFALDETGDFVVVVGHAWLMKKGAVQADAADTELSLAMLAYLNSSVAMRLLGYVSIQVSGGQWDLSKKYLSNLPIPDLGKVGHPVLGELVEAGVAVSKGQVEWREVDRLVRSILRLHE